MRWGVELKYYTVILGASYPVFQRKRQDCEISIALSLT